ILEELKYANPTKTETECRTILGCFLFTGEDVFKKIKVLSGGEKSRVALAKVLVSEANFLLLDEPTNHLDMQSVNILIQALQQYEGSYVVVSHDRFFVEAIANKIWYIEDQQVKQYPGTYTEYEWWQEDREEEESSQSAVSSMQSAVISTQPAVSSKQSTGHSSQSTVRSSQSVVDVKALQKKVAQLEAQIEELEKRKTDTEAKLAQSDVYNNPTKLAELNRFYADIKQQISKTTDEWETALMQLEDA
nr:ATP-binding cassette domain-containing protein [Spirosomataceae bacterium]